MSRTCALLHNGALSSAAARASATAGSSSSSSAETLEVRIAGRDKERSQTKFAGPASACPPPPTL